MIYEQPAIEKAFAADPAFPPVPYWPMQDLCPECFTDIVKEELVGGAPTTTTTTKREIVTAALDHAACGFQNCGYLGKMGDEESWNMDAVFDFLCKFYDGCHGLEKFEIQEE